MHISFPPQLKKSASRNLLVIAGVLGAIALFGFVSFRVSNAEYSSPGSWFIAPDSIYISVTEGLSRSTSFAVTNVLPLVRSVSCPWYYFWGCPPVPPVVQIISLDIGSNSPEHCLSVRPIQVALGSSQSASISVTASGDQSCASPVITIVATRQNGFSRESLEIPVFVSVNPINIPYAALSSKRTFTVTPGLVSGAGTRGRNMTFTIANISGSSVLISAPAGPVSIPPGGSKDVSYFCCSNIDIPFRNISGGANGDDSVTVPTSWEYLPPIELNDNGNRIDSGAVFTFPPSVVASGTKRFYVAHGDSGGTPWFFSGSNIYGSQPPQYSLGPLAPGTYYYTLNGMHFGWPIQEFPGGTVGFTVPSSTGGLSGIVKSVWRVTGGPDGNFFSGSTCSGACDYPVSGLPPGDYQARLTVTNTAGLSAIVSKNFTVSEASPPSCTFGANPDRIVTPPPGSSNLSWTCQDATVCSISDVGAVSPASGTKRVSPKSTTAYTLSCSGAGGSTSKSATIRVLDLGGGHIHEISPGQP